MLNDFHVKMSSKKNYFLPQSTEKCIIYGLKVQIQKFYKKVKRKTKN